MTSSLNKSDRIEKVVNKYSDVLLRVAFSYMKNINDAEDIVHDTFIKLMENKPFFENEEHKKAWLIRVTINLCKNRFKTPWFRKTISMDNVSLGFTQEESEVLESVLDLPDKYRIVIHLYYYQGYSIREISNILEIKEPTIASQLQRGRKILKSKLREGFDYE